MQEYRFGMFAVLYRVALLQKMAKLKPSSISVNEFKCYGVNAWTSAYAEESGRVPTVVATGMPKTGEMVFFEVESRLHLDYLEKITKDVSEGIRHVHRQLEELILRKKD